MSSRAGAEILCYRSAVCRSCRRELVYRGMEVRKYERCPVCMCLTKMPPPPPKDKRLSKSI